VPSLANRYLGALLSRPPGPRSRAGYSFWQRYWASLTGTALTPRPVQAAAAQFSDTRMRAGQLPGPATGVPHAVTNAGVAGDLADFGAWVPSAPRRGSYRQRLVVASAAFAVFIVVAVAVLIKTVAHTSSGSVPTVPVAPIGGNPTPIPTLHPGPKKAYDTLLTKIPAGIQGQDTCRNVGTSVGATVVSLCASLHGLAVGTIYYYLFPDKDALNNGFSGFLQAEGFINYWECTKTGTRFVDFIAECESGFTNTARPITGSVAEYRNTVNDPIIVSTDDQQLAMAVMAGTNDGDLLSYWRQFNWIAPVLQGKSIVDVQAYARALMAEQQGWGATQFACLRQLWNQQSGWRYYAQNASGAYGIPQALPGSKMASAGEDWQTNPATQVEWGLGYIKSIYGTPCRAWTFNKANGYY
jgi:hypothetical protein